MITLSAVSTPESAETQPAGVGSEANTAPSVEASTARGVGHPLPGWLAIGLVTGTSAAVLVLEILAGRLLAPYVGVSLETFTGIIGVILAGIAVGAWAGGVAADRVDPRRLLPPLLMLGGALAIATIPIVRTLGDTSGSGGGVRILILTTFGFLPSATVLSAVPPAVIKLQLLDLASTGSTVGRLSAWSTAGALFGTFFTGYVLVAAAAVTTLIVVVGLVLVASGVALWAVGRVRQVNEVLSLTGLAALSLVGVAAIESPCETQTAYYCLSVIEDPDLASGRTLLLDDLRHSYVDLDDPERLQFWYVRRLVDAIETETAGPIDIAYIGGGAFTVPRYIRATRPGSEQVVMEIDGDLVDVVEEQIDFDRGDDVDIIVGDGRLSIRDLPAESADVIVGDAFGGRAVPFHLATREFIEELDLVLRADGVYVANIIDGPDERFVKAYAATVAEVFEHVVVIRGPGALQGFRGNTAVIAGHEPLDVEQLQQRLTNDLDPSDGAGQTDDPDRVVGEIVTGDALADYTAGADVITDDFAPVDQLLAASS